MAGRKLKPTALKKLEGNPGKRKLNTKEPVSDSFYQWLQGRGRIQGSQAHELISGK